MPPAFDRDESYGQFVAMSGAAAAAGHYEVAYHALMAALHCAEGAGDTARLAEVARACRAHLRAVDAAAPAHRLSTETAKAHGHRSIFDMGATMAEAALKRVESEQRMADYRRDRAGT